ncbi:MAG: ATP synthase F0 subunit A [Nitrospirae bacterium CG2_30_53_67]|nr:MAG: ATP synthase F0 subunit A [Nitrospirae bacterium CG2_30_53_67]
MHEPPMFLSFLGYEYLAVGYAAVTVLLLILMGKIATSNLALVPAGVQNFFEVVLETIMNFMAGVMGEKNARRFFPMIATFSLFIFTCNMMGIFPGMYSATSNLNITVACAVIVFISVHFFGVKEHGFKYLLHFMGPVIWLAPLMLPIEIIGHLARPVSHSLRLFGNIMGEDTLLIILAGLVPLLVPLPIMVLMIFTSFVQTFVFVLLAILYIQGSVEHAEEH